MTSGYRINLGLTKQMGRRQNRFKYNLILFWLIRISDLKYLLFLEKGKSKCHQIILFNYSDDRFLNNSALEVCADLNFGGGGVTNTLPQRRWRHGVTPFF